MYFVMYHAPGAGLVAQPVGQKSSALPLYHGCPLCVPLELYFLPNYMIEVYSVMKYFHQSGCQDGQVCDKTSIYIMVIVHYESQKHSPKLQKASRQWQFFALFCIVSIHDILPFIFLAVGKRERRRQ